MKKYIVLLLTITTAFMLIVPVFLGLWLVYYQPSDVVIRNTFVDGRVEVSGGRIPWRRPDFVACASRETPIILLRKDGTHDKLEKVEIWLRDKSSQDKLRKVFHWIQTPEKEPGYSRNQ